MKRSCNYALPDIFRKCFLMPMICAIMLSLCASVSLYIYIKTTPVTIIAISAKHLYRQDNNTIITILTYNSNVILHASHQLRDPLPISFATFCNLLSVIIACNTNHYNDVACYNRKKIAECCTRNEPEERCLIRNDEQHEE